MIARSVRRTIAIAALLGLAAAVLAGVVSANTVPSKPEMPTVEAGERSLSVSWTAPSDGGSAITGYDVGYCDESDANNQCWENDNSGWKSHSHSGTGTSTTISGLTNDNNYSVRVRAKNVNGSSEWSDHGTGTPTDLPGKPTSVGVTNGDESGELDVSWTAPSDVGGTSISYYDVQYCSSNCSDSSNWTSESTIDGTTTSKTLTGLTNGTSYQVQVRAVDNEGDYSPWTNSVNGTPSTTPQAPDSLTITVGETQLTASWSAPSDNGGSAIIGYDVEYCDDTAGNCYDDNHADWTSISHSGTGTTTTKTGLTNGTTYYFHVRSKNANGTSSWSTSASGIPVDVPGKPTSVTVARGDASGELDVSWTAPTDTGGTGSTISSYDVQYCSSSCSDDSNWTSESTSDGTTTSKTLTGLNNGTSYQVQVRAVDSDSHQGPWTSSVSGTPDTAPDAPSDPTVTRGNASLSVSWDEPSNSGSAITGYVVRRCSSNCDNSNAVWTSTNVSGRTTTTTTLSSLTNGTTYSVQVAAKNAAGTGSYSGSTTGTPATKPSTPSAPTVTRADESLEVSWTAPANGGDAIDTYDVGHCTGTCSNDSDWTVAEDETGTSKTIGGLTNGTTYKVRVLATNDVGDSLWSSATSGTPSTKPTKPGAPTLTAGNQQIAVTWSAPSSNGGATISSYDVQYKKTSDNTWTDASHSGTSRTKTIIGLTNGTEYEVQVQATNVAGDSGWSDSTKATPDILPGKPAAPTVTRADESLVVSWTAPSNTGSAISDYDVQYKKTSVSTWTEWNASNTSTTRSATITGLTNGTSYHVQVRATNGAGDTAWSNSTTGTPSTMPTKPAKPTLNPGDKRIAISWAAPNNGGATISSYDLQYKKTSDNTWTDASHSGTSRTKTITGLDNGVEYEVQVQATNVAGDSGWSDSTKATPDVLPSKPGAPTVARGNASLSVSWTAPSNSGSAISDYDVQYKKTSVSTWTEWNASNTSTTLSATITGLTNGTSYHVQVRATNGAGDTAWSNSTTGTPSTTPSKPDKPSLNASNAKIDVTWSAPDDGGAAISDYDVQYCSTGCNTASNWTEWKPNNTSTSRSASITGLTNGTEYEVQVRATNTNGDSDWSDSEKATPDLLPDKPNAPTVARGNTSLSVSWTKPSSSGSAITGFKVGYCSSACGSVGSWTSETVTGGNATSTTISNLTNGTSYQVKVRATNDKGDGPWSNSTSGTPSTTPSKPAKPTLEVGSQKLVVSWTAPSDGGAAISDYDVQYCSTGCDTASNWTEWNASNTSTKRTATITGLTNGTEYEVQVRATNVNGDSDWSDSEKATPAIVPGKPDEPTIEVGTTSLKVTWTAPSNDGTAITGYKLEYKESSDSDWTDAQHSGTGLSKTLDSLTTGTEYSVRVRASNSGGDGPWSNTATATPVAPPAAPANVTTTPYRNALVVSWATVAGASGYAVQYSADAGTTWTSHSHSGTSTSTTITGLTNDTVYQVQVRAVNANSLDSSNFNWGPSTSTDSERTPLASLQLAPSQRRPAPTPYFSPPTPGQPSAPTLEVGATLLKVSWMEPSNSGSTISGYDVQYKESAAGSWTDAEHSGTEPSLTISGLTTGAEYSARVRASNGGSGGAWSEAASATLVATPAAPTKVETTPYLNALTVGWEAVEEASGYEVQYRAAQADDTQADSASREEQDWITSLHSGTGTGAVIAELSIGATYEVRVRAVNANTLDVDDFNWAMSGSSASQRTPLEGLPAVAPGTGVDEEIGPPTYRGNITALPDRDRWAMFWFPVLADSCAKDAPSRIQPGWTTAPDPTVCGALYLGGAARDGLPEPAVESAFAAHAAVIAADPSDGAIQASAPQGYERSGAVLNLDLWAIYTNAETDAEQASETVTRLLGEVPPPVLVCLPHQDERDLAIGQWIQEDQTSGESASGWRILEPVVFIHEEHICASVDRLSRFALFRQP